MIFNLLQVVDTTLVQAAPVQQEMKLSLIDLASKGGWLMIILLILSVIAIYIFGNKWWMIHKAGQIDRNFMKDIHDLIHDGKIKSATELCQRYDSPVARLVEKGIECPVKEHAPLIGPLMQQLLFFLLIIGFFWLVF